jgi:hypothetical protein
MAAGAYGARRRAPNTMDFFFGNGRRPLHRAGVRVIASEWSFVPEIANGAVYRIGNWPRLIFGPYFRLDE